jgi:hypothetical protein
MDNKIQPLEIYTAININNHGMKKNTHKMKKLIVIKVKNGRRNMLL